MKRTKSHSDYHEIELLLNDALFSNDTHWKNCDTLNRVRYLIGQIKVLDVEARCATFASASKISDATYSEKAELLEYHSYAETLALNLEMMKENMTDWNHPINARTILQEAADYIRASVMVETSEEDRVENREVCIQSEGEIAYFAAVQAANDAYAHEEALLKAATEAYGAAIAAADDAYRVYDKARSVAKANLTETLKKVGTQ